MVLSGFSALSPLAQLGLASVGDSHDEVLKAIGLPNDEVVSMVTLLKQIYKRNEDIRKEQIDICIRMKCKSEIDA